MIQHRFEYRAPRTINEAVGILKDAGSDCAVLGGGTWLIPNMTFAAHRPKVVLDPKHLGLASISELEDEVLVGARATYADILRSQLVSTHLPLLASMASGITGGISITGQGTIGGSACYGNPSSDVPACLIALRARLRLRSTKGDRDVEATDFFRGSFATTRRPDEMLTAIILPKAIHSARWGYYKLKFSTGSWPIMTAAAIVEGDRARVALGAATAIPILSEATLPTNASADELGDFARFCAIVSPHEELADELAGPGYRRRVAHSIVLRALEQCRGAR
ncbi:FAD binding domain-containing protein [Bradyrhizobium australafricanum]|uniref:FAD binding domain-containing protein n=1 Tax=Bradyrhizobium australafricanum TaxID=2821406 RepID=UPI001CE2E9BE|nr:FAD binding domain-containing protein [Bradyrhizobium australafricanum]MCA6100544.1 FAD binding domain-containing protein [Bradyrhizobium australafricanum]